MKKDLKLKELAAAAPALSAVAALDKLPAKTAYGVARMLSSIEPALTAYNKVRLALVKQYGEEKKDEKEMPAGRWQILPKNEEAYIAAHDELLAQAPAETVTVFRIKLADLCDADGKCRVTPGDLANLEFCIEE